MLLSKFEIDIDKIKKRNKELINMNWIDKLSIDQKKFLNFRKGNPTLMNIHGMKGYTDLTNYLIDPESFSNIDINSLKDYFIIYEIKQKYNSIMINNINEDLKKILIKIQQKRIENIQKYIEIEDSIFEMGIKSKDIIYRTQNTKINGSIIKNSSSWSLIPLDFFCYSKECHLYITKIPNNLKVIYLENKNIDNELSNFQEFDNYEFEYLLPRNLEFIEVKTKNIKIPNDNVTSKSDYNNYKEKKITIHWIKIIKKIKHSIFPVIYDVKLIIPMNV
jgi:hypothetical protein